MTIIAAFILHKSIYLFTDCSRTDKLTLTVYSSTDESSRACASSHCHVADAVIDFITGQRPEKLLRLKTRSTTVDEEIRQSRIFPMKEPDYSFYFGKRDMGKHRLRC